MKQSLGSQFHEVSTIAVAGFVVLMAFFVRKSWSHRHDFRQIQMDCRSRGTRRFRNYLQGTTCVKALKER